MTVAVSPPPEAWTEWGGSGPLLVFGHANGFPPATYALLLRQLSGCFRVATMAARPLWPGTDPTGVSSWHELAADLRTELIRRGERPAVAAGHSLGSVLNLLAAAADPSLFGALALVDPVIFTGVHALFWGAFKNLGVGHRLPLVRGARRRRDRYPSREAALTSYARKPVFASWLPEVLRDYVACGFADTADGTVRLTYPKAWEARIFETTPASVWSELAGIDLPILILRGAESDTFRRAAARRARRQLPTATVAELAGSTHFVPMERPREVAARIIAWWHRLAANTAV